MNTSAVNLLELSSDHVIVMRHVELLRQEVEAFEARVASLSNLTHSNQALLDTFRTFARQSDIPSEFIEKVYTKLRTT